MERPGEVVTREELRKRIWPADTYVDFDHGLYSAIKRLRDALGDFTDSPRYIQTLSRRGYRLIAPINGLITETPVAPPAVPETVPEVPKRLVPQIAVLALAALAGAGLLLGLLVGFNASGLRERFFGSSSSKPITSLAVLPLENLSGDPGQEYFADGMTDELITDLAKLGHLRVISRTSAMQYKGARMALPQIARELKVDAVLEGSVERTRDRVRIRVQLIRAATDEHLWAETYERDLGSVPFLEGEVALDVAHEVRAQLTPEVEQRLHAKRAVNLSAYEAYLKGRYWYNKMDERGLQKSLEYYQQATAADPSDARAYAGLADSYSALSTVYLAPREVMPKAKAAAEKALQLDDTFAEAHASLGRIELFYSWDWPAAEKHLTRAIELNPNCAQAHAGYAGYLTRMGREQEAIAETRRALELDPLSLPISFDLEWDLLDGKQYDLLIEHARKMLQFDPDFSWAHTMLGMACVRKGLLSDAVKEASQGTQNNDSPVSLAMLGETYAAAGDRKSAQRVLGELKQQASRRYVCPHEVAALQAALQEKDQALGSLEKAYEVRSDCVPFLAVDPRMDSLRSDPRFQALLRRIGMR